MGFITEIHTHKLLYQWNNTRMGQNVSFHIHVKSEHGYSPKYPERVFSVFGLSLRRHGFDHKLRQITNCDNSSAICECRNLWWLQIQLFRLMWIVPEGILLNAEKMFTSTSGPIKKVFLCTSIMGLITDIHIHRYRYNSETTPKWAKMKLFIFMSKLNMGTLPSTYNTLTLLFESVCHFTVMIANCDKSQIATKVSQFVIVAICDGS